MHSNRSPGGWVVALKKSQQSVAVQKVSLRSWSRLGACFETQNFEIEIDHAKDERQETTEDPGVLECRIPEGVQASAQFEGPDDMEHNRNETDQTSEDGIGEVLGVRKRQQRCAGIRIGKHEIGRHELNTDGGEHGVLVFRLRVVQPLSQLFHVVHWPDAKGADLQHDDERGRDEIVFEKPAHRSCARTEGIRSVGRVRVARGCLVRQVGYEWSGVCRFRVVANGRAAGCAEVVVGG